MINVILLEKISKLGNIGQEVKVKDGFARNYLLPNKKAIRASDENKKIGSGGLVPEGIISKFG